MNEDLCVVYVLVCLQADNPLFRSVLGRWKPQAAMLSNPAFTFSQWPTVLTVQSQLPGSIDAMLLHQCYWPGGTKCFQAIAPPASVILRNGVIPEAGNVERLCGWQGEVICHGERSMLQQCAEAFIEEGLPPFLISFLTSALMDRNPIREGRTWPNIRTKGVETSWYWLPFAAQCF